MECELTIHICIVQMRFLNISGDRLPISADIKPAGYIRGLPTKISGDFWCPGKFQSRLQCICPAERINLVTDAATVFAGQCILEGVGRGV